MEPVGKTEIPTAAKVAAGIGAAALIGSAVYAGKKGNLGKALKEVKDEFKKAGENLAEGEKKAGIKDKALKYGSTIKDSFKEGYSSLGAKISEKFQAVKKFFTKKAPEDAPKAE